MRAREVRQSRRAALGSAAGRGSPSRPRHFLVLCVCLSLLGDDGWARSAPASPESGASGEPARLLVVGWRPPAPPARTATGSLPVHPRLRRGRHARAHVARYRRPAVYLRARPGGQARAQLRVGVLVDVVKREGSHAEVATTGPIRMTGFVPAESLGLRVLASSPLYDRPKGTPIGMVSAGSLVHLDRHEGAYSRVRLAGYFPLWCFVERSRLGTAPAKVGQLVVARPGSAARVVSPGPLHERAQGKVIARITSEGSARVVKESDGWVQVAAYGRTRVDFRAWVPKARIRRGRLPMYGPGYRQNNCPAGRSGNMTAIAAFDAYAAWDDAWTSVRFLPGARFRVTRGANEGYTKVHSGQCVIFTAYVPARSMLWMPLAALRRAR